MKLYIKSLGPLGTNCYLIAQGACCAVIDPGAQADQLLAFLQTEGLQVEAVLLTHGHYDHTGAVKKLVQAFACPVYIGESDAPMLADPEKSLARFRGMSESEYPIATPNIAKNGDSINVNAICFTAMETPGHTAGGMTYRCGEWLLTGDTLFRESVGRSDFPGGDFGALNESVQQLFALEGDLRVLPGHGPETTLAWERGHNPFVRMLSDDDFY